MTPSLRMLLAGAIDYAGMFPPASLSLQQSASNYFDYLAGPDAWMLGRFVCPASRLHELASFAEKECRHAPNHPTGRTAACSIAAVLRGGATHEEWRASLRGDLQIVREAADRLKIDAVEVRLPDEIASDGCRDERSRLLAQALGELAEVQSPGIQAFVESPAVAVEARGKLVQLIVNELAGPQAAPAGGRGRIAFKLRTGGATPQAFLSSAELAQAICTLRDRGVFWKATAGLHHPLRHDNPQIGAAMPGFVNVLVAAALAEIHRLPEGAVRAILDDESAGDFKFAADVLQWRDWAANVEQIGAARRRSLVSFGSCSFDEPREDLRALGWL